MSVADGKLKNFSAFVDGIGYAGNVTSGQLPNITLTGEDFRGGGMDAPVKVETGMEGLEASLVISKLNADIRKEFGKRGASDSPLVLRGALEDLDGSVKAAVATIRGKLFGIEEGEWKAGEQVESTYNFNCTYYKLELAGEVFHEIDVLNMVRIVNGIDQLKAQRDALGI